MIQAETICANLLQGVCWTTITHPTNVMSAPEPKHLPSTIVRDDEGALVSLAKSGDLGAFDERRKPVEGVTWAGRPIEIAWL